MVVLSISIILFNFIAWKINRFPMLRVVHIWTFTIAFQMLFDIIIEFKYQAYWYFDKGIDLFGFLGHTLLIPPVNIMLLNWFPFHTSLIKKSMFIIAWTFAIMIYEILASLPEPWGFFHYGWWKLWYEIIALPILLFILLSL